MCEGEAYACMLSAMPARVRFHLSLLLLLSLLSLSLLSLSLLSLLLLVHLT